MTVDVLPGDGCDTNITNANPAPELSEAQRRFLGAYRRARIFVAPAARLAGVCRSTVYRWRKDAAFAEALREALEQFFREHREEVQAQVEERRRWREQRERERRPMRREILARAREARRR